MVWKLRLALAALVLVATASVSLSLPNMVFAADPLSEICTGNTQSETCQSQNTTTNPLTGTDGTLYKVSSIIAAITGVVAVVVIVISGFRYMTSGGDAQKVASAKSTLIGAIIGLVIIVLAQAIITFVVRKL